MGGSRSAECELVQEIVEMRSTALWRIGDRGSDGAGLGCGWELDDLLVVVGVQVGAGWPTGGCSLDT